MYLKTLTNYAFNAVSKSFVGGNDKKIGGQTLPSLSLILSSLVVYCLFVFLMIKIWNNQGVRILSLTPVQEDVHGLWDMICLSILVKFLLE